MFFSFSAVSKNIAAICSYPSFFAWEAKKVYRFRAWDSPANAPKDFFLFVFHADWHVFSPFKLLCCFDSQLCLIDRISPSFTIYSFPSSRQCPVSFVWAKEPPAAIKWSYETTSARWILQKSRNGSHLRILRCHSSSNCPRPAFVLRQLWKRLSPSRHTLRELMYSVRILLSVFFHKYFCFVIRKLGHLHFYLAKERNYLRVLFLLSSPLLALRE